MMLKVLLDVDVVGCAASARPSLLKYHSLTYSNLATFCLAYSEGCGDLASGMVTP